MAVITTSVSPMVVESISHQPRSDLLNEPPKVCSLLFRMQRLSLWLLCPLVSIISEILPVNVRARAGDEQ